jgi:group I intron endonuclease
MFIYLIDYNYNNWYYVGKTSNSIEKRFNSHIQSVKKNKTKHHKCWNKAISNNKQPEILILEEANNNNINELEKWYIAYFKSIGVKLTNMTNGGDGLQGHIFSSEHKTKISKANKGKKCKWTLEGINNIKMANSKPRSEEFKEKIREIRLGSKWSDNTKKKISESNKGKHNENNRKRCIKQIDKKTGEIINIFKSINEAALSINPNKLKSIRSSIECAANPKGKQNTSCGFRWEY